MGSFVGSLSLMTLLYLIVVPFESTVAPHEAGEPVTVKITIGSPLSLKPSTPRHSGSFKNNWAAESISADLKADNLT